MNSSQGSFIPKSPVSNVKKKRPVRRLYILSYIVYSLFVGAIVLTAFTFLYSLTQNQALKSKSQQLQETRSAFQTAELDSIVALDRKLDHANTLLSNYNSIPTLLAALEEVTLSSLTLQSFSYQKVDGGQVALTLSANTNDFNLALFQREQLRNSNVFSGATISGVSYANANGQQQVQFTISQAIRPGQLAFQEQRANVSPITAPVSAETSEDVTGATSDSFGSAAETATSELTPNNQP